MVGTIPIITLITDFGLKDEYSGVVKGVILATAPNARIVDITHLIPPQSVQTASHLLARAFGYFPPGTVHLVIVDPGVGTSRSILAIAADSQYFIGPDNGIFTPIYLGAASLVVHRVTAADLFLATVGATFHGRDIMAPIAAKLATGLDIDKVGPRIAVQDCVHTLQNTITRTGDMLQGEIVHVDNFGNLCSNISRQAVEKFADSMAIVVRVAENNLIPLCHSYGDRARGDLLALYDSHDYLEIAVNQGSAACRLNLTVGARIFLSVCLPGTPTRQS
jgi:hypothetical protein